MKKAIILMGLPLAGKSSWIKEYEYSFKYVIVSADEIKEKHPDYNPLKADELHEYSVKKAEERVREIAKDNIHILLDSGSINNSYTKRIITFLRSENYVVELVHVKTPYTICLERNKLRERKVPESAIIYKAVRENAQFHRLLPLVNSFKVVDYFTNMNLFVDMDGVIASLSTLPKVNGEIDFVNAEVHRYLAPVTPIIDKLKSLMATGINVHILSAIPNSFSYTEKNEWLNEHFDIDEDKRFFVNQGKHKGEMLENLAVKLKLEKKSVTMIDDIHDTLYRVKERGMNCMHVSEFLIHEFEVEI